ncbi:MAG: DotU family type IV/VI secretion system protein [Pirellulaceae bacterium]|nr:DotU family type IV/VI secretion system protein [Pirellulaceae bacterium]
MTPRMAVAVDPIFLHVLDLQDRIAREEQPDPQEERHRIKALIDQAEAIMGASPEWEHTKYAIVSWIDEVLVDTNWNGQEWWSNNVLEMALFSTRLCHEQFYTRAQEASTFKTRDALEVFYVCVVLGFRGLYRDEQTAQIFAHDKNLPPDLDTWAKQTSMAIRLGQGRPQLMGPGREISGAPPIRTKSYIVWPWLAAAMLLACNVVAVYYFYATS